MKQGGCCSHVRLCLVRVWGTWGGVLGLAGANEGIWRCRGTDAPWWVSEPPTQVNHPVLSSAKCAQAWVNHSCDGCGVAQGTAEIRDKISQGSQWIGLYRLVRWNRNSTSQEVNRGATEKLCAITRAGRVTQLSTGDTRDLAPGGVNLLVQGVAVVDVVVVVVVVWCWWRQGCLRGRWQLL